MRPQCSPTVIMNAAGCDASMRYGARAMATKQMALMPADSASICR